MSNITKSRIQFTQMQVLSLVMPTTCHLLSSVTSKKVYLVQEQPKQIFQHMRIF